MGLKLSKTVDQVPGGSVLTIHATFDETFDGLILNAISHIKAEMMVEAKRHIMENEFPKVLESFDFKALIKEAVNDIIKAGLAKETK